MINFSGLFFAVLFMSFFVWLFVSTYRFAVKSSNDEILGNPKSRFVFAVFSFAGACLFYYLLCQNRYVYSWDYGCYWSLCFTQAKDLFFYSFLKNLARLFKGFFSDYNLLLPTLVAFPFRIVGYSFVRYVLMNYVLFVVPALFILLSVVIRQVGKKYIFLVIFMLFTFNQFYLPTLNGYIDIAALIPASIALLLMKDYDAVSFNFEQFKCDVYG